MPEEADPAAFILSDGRLKKKKTASPVNTVGDLFRIYDLRLPEGVKEPRRARVKKYIRDIF